jgi:glycerate 2-kinase
MFRSTRATLDLLLPRVCVACERPMDARETGLVCALCWSRLALLPAPLAGLTLAHEQAVSRALLRSGATISEMNCVRRHLSAIKGGRLAAACHPARVVTLLISDVPGDNPMDIGSGPTVADPTSCADALAILQRYRIDVPPAALDVLQSGRGESIKPGDARLAASDLRMIATPQAALVEKFQELGVFLIDAQNLHRAADGQFAQDGGAALATQARQPAAQGQSMRTSAISAEAAR